jgi:hypothetical protein
MEKQKCDYCLEADAKYIQTLEISNLETGEKEILWQRYSCENCKDQSET